MSDKNHIFNFSDLDGTSADFTKGRNSLQTYLFPWLVAPAPVVTCLFMDGTDGDFMRAYHLLKDKIGAGNIKFENSSGSPIRLKLSDGSWSEPYTWHHHQDGKSMIPVLQSVHQSVTHTGGRAIVNNGLINLFSWNY